MNYSAYIDAHQEQFQQDLFELLRIPSVSAAAQYRPDVGRAALWVADQFRALKLQTELVETAGNPIVLAESPPVPGAPTVLVYGHYDVQPPDPLGEWISPPFEPTIRGGNVYARGATDDKGQMLTHVNAAEAWLRTAGSLPVQLKFVIEGEEEVGSESLVPFIQANLATPGLRLRGDQRYLAIRSRPSGDHVWPAGHRLFRAAADRPQAGFALRHLRRRRGQPGQYLVRALGWLDQRPWPGAGRRLL